MPEPDNATRAQMPSYQFAETRVYPSVRPDLLPRLPDGLGDVLDVGCGTGTFGASLVDSGKATSVFGVDISAEAVEQAESRLRGARVVDLDSGAVDLPDASIDTIIYADVLEHLKFPWATVRAQRQLLRPVGRAFCSIPNVGHYRVMRQLLRQDWRYESEGIFDYTHLRFFTRNSLEAMFTSGGYTRVATTPLDRPSTRNRVARVATAGLLGDALVRAWWLEAHT